MLPWLFISMCIGPPALVNVKLDDLLVALRAEARRHPTDAENWVNLAHGHAYAYLRSDPDTVLVEAKFPNRVFFGGGCSCMGMPPIFEQWASAPLDPNSEHLRHAIHAFRLARQLDKGYASNGYSTLELSWVLEKHGETAAAITAYRSIFDQVYRGHRDQLAAGERLLALSTDPAQHDAVAARLKTITPPELQE